MWIRWSQTRCKHGNSARNRTLFECYRVAPDRGNRKGCVRRQNRSFTKVKGKKIKNKKNRKDENQNNSRGKMEGVSKECQFQMKQLKEFSWLCTVPGIEEEWFKVMRSHNFHSMKWHFSCNGMQWSGKRNDFLTKRQNMSGRLMPVLCKNGFLAGKRVYKGW